MHEQRSINAQIKDSLNNISPGMCLAKWYEMTLHLASGHNHSCHHVKTHQIPVEEIKRNINAIHNSEYKKSVRKEIFAGRRPQECSYCWNIEDTVTDNTVFSDRVNYSEWFLKRNKNLLNTVLENGPNADYYPMTLEVSFSTTCNFKCSYCSPDVSSRWMKDYEKNGSFPVVSSHATLENIQSQGKMPISDKEYNPYIEAFWQWIPHALPHLKNLRVTGGEPLLIKHTFKLIDWINKNPNKELEFGINSNLGVPRTIIDRFIAQTHSILDKTQSFTVWTSCEAQGTQAEYIRYGLDYDYWLSNCYRILDEIPGSNLYIMTTYALTSVPSYLKFLEDICELKKQFPNRVMLDTHNYLAHPQCLTVDILTEDFFSHIQQQREYIEKYAKLGIFDDNELQKVQRQENYFQNRMRNPLETNWLNTLRKDFAVYIDEYDRRCGTNFVEVFPELKDFYLLCKSLTLE